MKYLIFLLLFLWSCAGEVDEIGMILANAPDAGEPTYDGSDNFELSLGSYVDSSEIKYCVVNAPPKMEYKDGLILVKAAINKWENAVGKPFRRVDSSNQANIVIEFSFMDGTGGQLGQTMFPPHSKVTNWNRSMIIDAYDVNPESNLDPIQIIGHEFGHGVGLAHSTMKKSLMYQYYYNGQQLGIDDQLGARTLYNNKKKFYFEGRGYVPIEKNDQSSISENFKTSEFFSACSGYPFNFIFLDENLITAIQNIRYYYDQPVIIISSYRPMVCNDVAGGASLSKHMEAQAIDFKFVGAGWRATTEQFVDEIKNKGCLFQTLVNTGIGGFGAYTSSFHIDTRTEGLHHWYNKTYGLWGRFLDNGFYIDTEHPNGIEDGL